jgi:hypothetical protein
MKLLSYEPPSGDLVAFLSYPLHTPLPIILMFQFLLEVAFSGASLEIPVECTEILKA